MKSSPKLRPNGWDALAAAAVLALAALCVYISYRVSVNILENKEF
mgnify:CR=1 FL=1